jgi:DNA helicase-2/ATP-dependent DNA helicase PcrA
LRPAAVEAWDDYTRRRVELYMEYEAQCQREGCGFPELLLRSYELLERNEPIRRHYQARFRHILVDEFQDTNVLQYRWLSCWPARAGGRRQPVLRGRRRPVDLPLPRRRDRQHARLRARFPGGSVIRLEQNYRSHGNILDAANALIANNSKRLGKNLWTDRGAGEPIRVYEAFTDSDEARWIVEEIQSLVRDGMSRADIALLYRSNAQSRVLEHQLFPAAWPTGCMAGCASSSARRSSTRWPTCA